jgi:hypothetical protein
MNLKSSRMKRLPGGLAHLESLMDAQPGTPEEDELELFRRADRNL